jgi:hypothetical protein
MMYAMIDKYDGREEKTDKDEVACLPPGGRESINGPTRLHLLANAASTRYHSIISYQ